MTRRTHWISFAEYSIRPARSGDLDRLEGLHLALQDHLEAANPDLWRMQSEARVQLRSQISARLAAAHSRALVAEHQTDGVIGAVFGRIVTNERYLPRRAGIIDQVFVQRAHRRAGVGTRLVVELCQYFADQGVDDFSLRYVVGNREAAAFWEALGFTPRILTVGAHRDDVEENAAAILDTRAWGAR